MGKLMSTSRSVPNEAASEFLPLRSKLGRVRDAEMIRQDFIKSKGLMAVRANTQKPSPKSTEDEC
jgi:hypothetical protein